MEPNFPSPLNASCELTATQARVERIIPLCYWIRRYFDQLGGVVYIGPPAQSGKGLFGAGSCDMAYAVRVGRPWVSKYVENKSREGCGECYCRRLTYLVQQLEVGTLSIIRSSILLLVLYTFNVTSWSCIPDPVSERRELRPLTSSIDFHSNVRSSIQRYSFEVRRKFNITLFRFYVLRTIGIWAVSAGIEK